MERDENGRFAKGNRGGPGRPKKARDERYYEILQEKLTFEKWGEIVAKAIEQALDGDKEARKFLAGYAMGEPDRYLELAGPGGESLFNFEQWRQERHERIADVERMDGET